MSHTVILTLNDEVATFIHNYPGINDPSALVNKLIRAEMQASDIETPPTKNDSTKQALEEFVDLDTHAGD